MGRLSSKRRILITGASRGIGRETALLLAQRGHALVLAARNERALRELVHEIERNGGEAESLPMDVTSDESVAHAVGTLRKPVDVLVNNAGGCEQVLFARQSPAAQCAELELNYGGALRLTRALLSGLIMRSGSIVNVSSLVGSIASPTTANYGASKAALESWSHALRGELRQYGVKVTVFVAPHTRTEGGARTHFEGVPSLPVRYTAQALVRAIDRAPRKVAASPVYTFFLWLARMFPAFMEMQVARSVRGLLAPSESSPQDSTRA